MLGFSAAVIQGDRKWVGTGGFRTSAKQDRLNCHAKFPIFSITKTMMAVTGLRLVESGQLTLDDNISTRIDHVPHWRKVSLRHLLSHTSGVPDYGAVESYHRAVRRNPGTPWGFDDIWRCAQSRPWSFEPGTNWEYSNTNYWIVGQMVEQATGIPLGEALQREVFEPAGLTETIFPRDQPFCLTPGFSSYLKEDEHDIDISLVYHPGWAGPAGAVISTAGDVAAFYNKLFAGDLLEPELFKAMLTLVPVPGDHPEWFKPAYGLGIGCERDTYFGDIFGHGGAGPGYLTMVRHAPEYDLTAAVLCNSDRVSPDGVIYPLMKLFIQT